MLVATYLLASYCSPVLEDGHSGTALERLLFYIPQRVTYSIFLEHYDDVGEGVLQARRYFQRCIEVSQTYSASSLLTSACLALAQVVFSLANFY
jgi:hypothetical protein